MVHIKCKSADVRFPIFTSSNLSLKKTLIQYFLNKKDKFEKYKEIYALNKITLDIEAGDKIALIGMNGAGKSTLLRLFAGVYKPTSGEISTKGKICSMIDITYGFDGELSGRQNIIVRSLILGQEVYDIKKKIEHIVSFSELSEYIDYPIKIYSTGMLMRLAFSITTAYPSDIVLMDEWLSVGDMEFSQKSNQMLKNYIDNKKILILATHSRELANEICN